MTGELEFKQAVQVTLPLFHHIEEWFLLGQGKHLQEQPELQFRLEVPPTLPP